MGGCGSGQWYRWNKKPTDENFHRFSISRMKELGVIGGLKHLWGNWQWTCNGKVTSSIQYELNTLSPHDAWLRVYYKNTRTEESYDYKIRLSTTSPRYGGVRWWFHCPAQGCGRRVGVLYLAHIFACRHCHGMAYQSQNKALHDYYTDKAFRLASKLGHDGNLIDGFWGDKPKGMHWKTYNRRLAELNHATEMGMSCFVGRFGGNWL